MAAKVQPFFDMTKEFWEKSVGGKHFYDKAFAVPHIICTFATT